MVRAETADPIQDGSTLPAAGPLVAAAEWARQEGAWWAASFVFHMLLMCVLMLISTTTGGESFAPPDSFNGDFEKPPEAPPDLEPLYAGDPPIEPPPDLGPISLTALPSGPPIEQYNTEDREFVPRGGSGAAADGPVLGAGLGFPVVSGGAGIRLSGSHLTGWGDPAGRAAGDPFGGRGKGKSKGVPDGRNKSSERSVAYALDWLARHQSPGGGWSLADYRARCRNSACTGPGSTKSDAAATALALLPFLGAGQTHETKGPFQDTVRRGLYWLMQHQKPDGDLSAGGAARMYAHSLATITLCEAHGMTRDRAIGRSARQAVAFLCAAQHPRTGGWRYEPGDEGDTSVAGWAVMALKSAEMAGLGSYPQAFDGARQWLKLVSKGSYGGEFSYQANGPATPAMTAVGLLCSQYLGAGRNDPAMLEGARYLMAHMPEMSERNVYYWYYATQVMHNLSGPDWDQWNRRIRRTLVESQVKEGCAMGSWDPVRPSQDAWGEAGGRVMTTSLSALTLEVYYRYLPLYRLDGQ